MPRDFWRTTAEAVVSSVEAAYTFKRPITAQEAADFSDSSLVQATSGLALASDLGLLKETTPHFEVAHTLCRSLSASGQVRKAAALRLVLESYDPYRLFIERLDSTGDALLAARQVRTALSLSLHQDDVKETLLSLGQYAQNLVARGGGQYDVLAPKVLNEFAILAQGCTDDAAFESLVRKELGDSISQFVDRDSVIVALADSFSKTKDADWRGVVVNAGNGFESFLVAIAAHTGTVLTGAHGINSKIQKLKSAGHIPAKIDDASKYLGSVRNAADHGVDAAVGHAWEIGQHTGLMYPYVVCSMIVLIHNYVVQQLRPPMF